MPRSVRERTKTLLVYNIFVAMDKSRDDIRGGFDKNSFVITPVAPIQTHLWSHLWVKSHIMSAPVGFSTGLNKLEVNSITRSRRIEAPRKE
jgi:hypothetical protein